MWLLLPQSLAWLEKIQPFPKAILAVLVGSGRLFLGKSTWQWDLPGWPLKGDQHFLP